MEDPSIEANEKEWEGTGTFSDVTFSFRMVRSGHTMIVTVVLPGIIICLMGLLYIKMPRGGGDRINYLMIVLLTEIMFLVMLTAFVPVSY